jgi:tRNA-2-methylthio-N6-dimethylallyladenosine synthase
MSDRLLDTVAGDAKFCPLFELPIQAGNDAVLERMRRGYTAGQFRDLVARIRRRLPAAAINTDVIVGFPGETAAQFMDTFQILEDLRLDVIHLAQYSERPGTLAARHMPDDVPAAEKQRRWEMIEAQGKRILDEKHHALRGRQVAVLIEGRDAKRDRWWGRTPQGQLVFFPDAKSRLGDVVEVALDWTGPFTMIGHPAKT